jgi:hypothetical protein
MTVRRWQRESVWADVRNLPKEETPTRLTFTSVVRGDIATFVHGGLYTSWDESSADLRQRFSTAVTISGNGHRDVCDMLAWVEREIGPSARTTVRVGGESDRTIMAARSIGKTKIARRLISDEVYLSAFNHMETDWSCGWVYDFGTFLFAREDDAVAFRLAFM